MSPLLDKHIFKFIPTICTECLKLSQVGIFFIWFSNNFNCMYFAYISITYLTFFNRWFLANIANSLLYRFCNFHFFTPLHRKKGKIGLYHLRKCYACSCGCDFSVIDSPTALAMSPASFKASEATWAMSFAEFRNTAISLLMYTFSPQKKEGFYDVVASFFARYL